MELVRARRLRRRLVNPRYWFGPPSRWVSPAREHWRFQVINQQVAQRWALVLAFSVCFASLAPGHLFWVALSGLLLLAGLAAVGGACWKGRSPLAPHLTAWDEAAWSLTTGFGLQVWLGAMPAV
jgi:hypothetical protein